MHNKFLYTALSIFLLAGCATNEIIEASYSSEVDPDFSFEPTKSIAVFVSEQGNNLETKYYVNQIVSALKARGFENVYSYRDVKQTGQHFEIGIIVNVHKSTDSYQYDDANLGLVDSGQSTTNCTGIGNSVNCTQNKQKVLGVTGYSTKTGYLTGYYFTSTWFDVRSKQKVMSMFASSFKKGCSDRAIYEFLVAETLARLDFQRPNEYKYSVSKPKEYDCNY